MRPRHVRSTALRSVAYVPLAPELRGKLEGDGFLVVKFRSGHKRAHLVPAWACGLLMASRSKGRGYSKLIRRRYPSVKMEG